MNKQRILRELEQLLGESDLADAETLAKIDAMLWILYPRGVKPVEYAGLVRTIRVLDRLCAWHDAEPERDARAGTEPPYAREDGRRSDSVHQAGSASVVGGSSHESTHEPTYQASVSSVDYPDGDAPVVGRATDPDASPVVRAVVDDEATAPIIDHGIFTSSIRTTKAWQPMAGFALREQLTERAAPPQYTSIFKTSPTDEEPSVKPDEPDCE